MTSRLRRRAYSCGWRPTTTSRWSQRRPTGAKRSGQIKTHKPDLVFLDIQMPGFDGFSVIQGMMDVEPPLFVFVTAYGDHALRAFEAQAVDYLMKPVEEDRLASTLDRVRQRLSEKRSAGEAERLKEALAEHAPEAAEDFADAAPEGPAPDRFEKMINIKDQGQIFRVDVDTIERIDAAGDYMCIQTGENTLILRETMKDLEKAARPAPLPARPPLDDRQPRPRPAGEAAYQRRMLPGARFRCAGEGQPLVPRRRREVRALGISHKKRGAPEERPLQTACVRAV